jgi:hypothetical protein
LEAAKREQRRSFAKIILAALRAALKCPEKTA